MNPRSKIIVLIIAILISLSLAGTGLLLFQREHVKNIQLEDRIEELSAKQKATEARFLEAQKVLATLESRFKEATAQIDTLNSQLEQERLSKEAALAKIDESLEIVKQQNGLRLDLEKKLNKAQDDVLLIQSKLVTIESEKKTLQVKVKELEAKAQVELGKIVVSPETSSQSVKPQEEKAQPVVLSKPSAGITQGQEGKVLVLNKEYNFVVVNLGSKEGVVVGDQFSVYRGDKYIGDVKVEKVQEAMSAAGFLIEGVKNKVKEGDKVIKKS